MATQFRSAIYNSPANSTSIALATLKTTMTNSVPVSHGVEHQNTGDELYAIEKFLGTGSTVQPLTNSVLQGTGATTTEWTATPTLTSLTTTGAVSVGTTLGVTGAATFSSAVALNGIPTIANNVALTLGHNAGTSSTLLQDTLNDVILKVGTSGNSFTIKNSAAATYVQFLSVGSLGGKLIVQAPSTFDALLINGPNGSKSLKIAANNTNTQIIGQGGPLVIQGASEIDFGSTLLFTLNNTYNIGSGANHATDVFGQNAYSTVSDLNKKTDVQSINETLAVALMSAVESKTWIWKDETPEQHHHRRHSGFVAQQIKEQLDLLGIDTEDFAAYINEDGNLALRNEELLPWLLSFVQNINKRVKQLEQQ